MRKWPWKGQTPSPILTAPKSPLIRWIRPRVAPGISLTSEQETMADKIQEKYAGHLRSLNRDIQGIHNRLVSLDADKLVEIEKLLTKEQLAQLRAERQQTTAEQKVTATDNASKKAE